jgi:hemoglobin-like flavoprotein
VTQLEATSVPGVAKSGLLRNVPSLSSHEVDIIQESWNQVMAIHGVGAVSLFYKNLFAVGPHLETLFQRTK